MAPGAGRALPCGAPAPGARAGWFSTRGRPMLPQARALQEEPWRPRSTPSAALRTISGRSCTTPPPAPARRSTRPRRARSCDALEERGLAAHRHPRHPPASRPCRGHPGPQGAAPAAGSSRPRKAAGQVPEVDALVREGDTVRVGELRGRGLGDAGPLRRPRLLLVRGRAGAVRRRHPVHARLRAGAGGLLCGSVAFARAPRGAAGRRQRLFRARLRALERPLRARGRSGRTRP